MSTTSITRIDDTTLDAEIVAGQTFLPVMTAEQAKGKYQAMVEFTRSVMRPGVDFGIIPGTAGKNVLLKPGAEKLCSLFGLVPQFEEFRIVEDWEKGLFHYAFRCVLSRARDGKKIGEGIGSANSREKRYRRGGRVCPECGAATIKRSKFPPKGRDNDKPGWYCHEKAGGCGAQYGADDRSITEQNQVNDPLESADMVNTILKMAQKRALVAAVLVACNASEFFTQDLEDETDRAPARPSRNAPADEPLCDENGVELNLEDFDPGDATSFKIFFAAAARRRDLDADHAEKLLGTFANAAKLRVDSLSENDRRRLLDKALHLTQRSAEQLRQAVKRKTAQENQPESKVAGSNQVEEALAGTNDAAPPVDPLDEALGNDRDGLIAVLWNAARKGTPDVTRDEFDAAVAKFALPHRKKGIEDQLSKSCKRDLYHALAGGGFDFKTGRIASAAAGRS